jgi:uncharacterized protein (DUF1778 family)
MARRRTVLPLNCSTSESRRIHRCAEDERRTVSGYVLHVIMRTVEIEEQTYSKVRMIHPLKRLALLRPRTKMLVRCSQEEAFRVRTAAKRRSSTISNYVLHSLRRAWKAHQTFGDFMDRPGSADGPLRETH